MPPLLSIGLSLAPLFGDHAVLQRDKPLPVWGTAAPGESVAVEFRGQVERAVAGPDGRWIVQLRPIAANEAPADLVVVGRTTLTARDILVGDVWLASGQSNMEFTVKDARNAAQELAAANLPLIRHLKVDHAVVTSPACTISTSGWQVASPVTVADFTAVGFFFAREIQGKTGVPVGIVNSTWGGTTIEAWMSGPARDSTSIAATLDARWREALKEWTPERVARYSADMAAWNKAEERAKEADTKNQLVWPQPPATLDSPAMPGGLFYGMIAPLQPCALRGILWYQGESNTERAGEYSELFRTMIGAWRAGWGQGDLPFYFVQIANFGEPKERNDRGWPRLREAQTSALSLPATGMAVIIDIGQADNVHPVNKQDVGRRLALLAEAGTYGMSVECQGPEFAGMDLEGGALRVKFEHADGGLISKGQEQALEVAGADRLFHDATGIIDGATLVVSSPEVAEPVAIRYAWTNAPTANLYNKAGLPAVPFRSDGW